MPTGQVIKIDILSTWGDPHYIGLNGVEVFDSMGWSVSIQGSNVSAYPPDINILEGYGNDPRTADKLVDGSYFTSDDFHVWLAPFSRGNDHSITL